MSKKAMKNAGIFLVLALASVIASAQSRPGQIGHSAQGTLTVTVIVESSVGLVAGADGKQQLIVANAPDPKQTFSRQAPSVAYSFPGKPVRFEVTREMQLLNVTGGPASSEPVTLVTVVPR